MMMESPEPTSRRGFLDWVIGLCTAATGAAMLIPGMMYVWPAARGGGTDRVEVPGARDLEPGKAAVVRVGSRVVIVIRERNGFRAFSAVCTHLGCLVEWDSVSKKFLCPCHAAVFDENGAVVSGPPPAPLPAFEVKEIGEKVFVSAA